MPGEGEHKIMNFIREMKSSPNYPPNTRHVMYGQDADLIMLGLVTHEPHFTLLREVIDFNFHHSSSSTNALKAIQKFTKQSEFQLLHLSILREYLFYEFAQLASSSPSSSTSIKPTTTTTIANTATDDLANVGTGDRHTQAERDSEEEVEDLEKVADQFLRNFDEDGDNDSTE